MGESTKGQRSALGLVVLGLLYQEPMHVYRMQKLIEAYGKTRVVNVRSRASLYQAIDRLLRLGLVEVQETVHTEGYPDRVVYGITDAGTETAGEWLREMLRTPSEQFPEFVCAVSMMFGLPAEDARAQLEIRVQRLAAALEETRAILGGQGDLPRLFLLEEEYRAAMLSAELAWIRGIVADLREGRLSWDEEWLRSQQAGFAPPPDDSADPVGPIGPVGP
jgi:DNA-binding PadR family transcriptional regulator